MITFIMTSPLPSAGRCKFQGVRSVQGEYFCFNPLPTPRTLCDISGTAFSLKVTYMTQYENLLEYHKHLAYPSFISILCIPLCNKCLELNVSQIHLRRDGFCVVLRFLFFVYSYICYTEVSDCRLCVCAIRVTQKKKNNF